jgi:hypothetical protein
VKNEEDLCTVGFPRMIPVLDKAQHIDVIVCENFEWTGPVCMATLLKRILKAGLGSKG